MKREPSLYIGAIGTLLSLIGTFGLDFLTPAQAALVIVVLNAILGVVTALKVRPVQPAAFTYLVSSLATLGAAYGLNFSEAQVAGVNAALIAILALILRGQVSPTESGVRRA